MSPPSSDQAVSYAAQIKPLFREGDRTSMLSHFDLWSYDDVKENAVAILGQLEGGTMPCDAAWPADRVDVFRRWLSDGTPA